MNSPFLRRALYVYLVLLVPFAWLAAKYDRYGIDGDAVAYMDIADLLRQHRWSEAVNGYWHPLYPAALWLGQVLFHSTRANELGAYYGINYLLFLLQAAAMLWFVSALVRLRTRMASAIQPLLSVEALQLVSLALLTISMMRELSLGKVRTDGLLQALILLALALMMEALAAESFAMGVTFAGMMGLAFGLAYLTKSFAFILALLSVLALVLFGWLAQKRSFMRAGTVAATALVAFAVIAGPYVAALSHQKHRFDFGDSGSLNYAWYVSGTEKMHLEPWMTHDFGSAKVDLIHPEKQLMANPGVYSYKALTAGTYPPWFDPTYFNERITPRFSLPRLLRRDARNAVLIGRYLLNHPEGLMLLALLLCAGGTLRGSHRFAWPTVGLGLLMWAIYAMVNVEERYVTAAYFVVLLPVLASMVPTKKLSLDGVRQTTTAAVLLFAMLTMGALVREDLANRRDERAAGEVPAWRKTAIYDAAEALHRMGVPPGAEVACIGEEACLADFYWARLAGLRILTEVYQPTHEHLMDRLDGMVNRAQIYETARREGAQVIVGSFDPGEVNAQHGAATGWMRLGETSLYALPLRTPLGMGSR